MSDRDEASKPVQTLSKEDKHKRFKSWLKLSAEAFADQRANELEDVKFQKAENQWPEDAKRERKGRPMLSISLLRHPMQLVQNQLSQAHVGVELHPVSEDADKDLAEVKQGLYSRIQRDGMAAQARLWGADRAKQVGLGWYRITTQYDEDSDNPTDQEIVYERILHQEMVYADPTAQKPDFSDGRFLFIAAYVPADSFRVDYEGAEKANASDFRALAATEPEWVRVNGGVIDPLVVECFYKVPLKDRRTGRTRLVVWRAVLTGCETVEDQPFMAPQDRPLEGRRYIPFVPVVGNELQPIEGKRYWEGMVRPARDSQVFYNFGASTLVERMAMEPKVPFIGYDDSIMPYKKLWDEANTRNMPYLPVKAVPDGGGGFLPLPQRAQIDQSGMSLAILALQQGKDFVESATAFNPASLGEAPKRRDAQSGRAIVALQGAAEAGSSQYMDNLESISLPLDARIVMDMMPVVYDRPGRVTQVLGAENKARVVILNAPFVEKDGRPVPAQSGAQGAKQYDLNRGRYAVVPTVGKPPQTRLERGQEFLTQVIQAVPELMPIIGDLVFEFRDEPGAKQIAERLRRQIMATNKGLLDDDKGSAEDAQAKATALQAQVQQLTGELQKASQYVQTEQAKHEAQVQIAQFHETAAMKIAEMNNAAKIEVARITAAKDMMNKDAEIKEERLATGLKIMAESAQTAVEQAHETRMQHQDHAHEVGMAAGGANTVTRTQEGGQDHAQEHSQETGHETMPQADGAGE